MKTLNPPASGLTCGAIRAWKSTVGSSSANQGLGSSHIAGCAACQAYFCAADQLDLAFRQSAAAVRVQPSDGLEQRLIYAVRRSSRAEAPRRSFGMNLVPLSSALAGVAVLALLFLPRPLAPEFPTQPRTVATTATSTESPSLETLWGALPRPTELLKKNPLQDEVEYVYSDAKSALRFLEMNFLPVASDTAPTQNGGV